VRTLWRWFVASFVLLLSRGHRPRPRRPIGELLPGEPVAPRAELLVAALLGLASLAAIGFVAEYALDADTQLLGLALGLALGFTAAACVVYGKRLVSDEPQVEPYGAVENPSEQLDVVVTLREVETRLTRKRLLVAAASGTGLALGAALAVPLASMGPVLDTSSLYRTPWRAGRRLVDRDGRPIVAADLEVDGFLSAYPEGANPKEIGSPLIVVRVRLDELDLPAARADWAPDGICGYSKICTHAGCAVAMYRAPLYPPTSPRPALVCPCHYSTFDARTGGTVIFGPAGRDLPQLPLEVDGNGNLVAAGNFSGPVGPSWWGVRLDEATSE
jgi:quinol---cytochrome c reductase iron-sulfur subunit